MINTLQKYVFFLIPTSFIAILTIKLITKTIAKFGINNARPLKGKALGQEKRAKKRLCLTLVVKP